MRLSERCYAVTGLGYSPPWCVNAGIVAGDNLSLVVDSGANTLAAQTIFGYASAVRPDNQLRVINTEKHFDHIGGNAFFLDRGIEVWARPLSCSDWFDLVRNGHDWCGEVTRGLPGFVAVWRGYPRWTGRWAMTPRAKRNAQHATREWQISDFLRA